MYELIPAPASEPVAAEAIVSCTLMSEIAFPVQGGAGSIAPRRPCYESTLTAGTGIQRACYRSTCPKVDLTNLVFGLFKSQC